MNTTMKKIYISIIAFGLFVAGANAQNLEDFLEGGVENGEALLEGYLEPAFKGFGYALNSGWYNTGQPHKLLGFDITGGVNLAMLPNSASYFKFKPSDYTGVTLGQPQNYGSNATATSLYDNSELPTLFGPNLNADDIPYLIFSENGEETIRVTAPTGSGIDEELPFLAVPAPFAQVGIGLIKNTEIKLRLVPETGFGDNSVKMFGLGVMHDVKQWIPGMKNLPFDLSGFFAFSKLQTVASIDEDNPDNTITFDAGGTTFQGIISKKLLILTVYGGLGVVTSSTKFKMNGDYEIGSGDDAQVISDPVSFVSKNNSMRANVGARLKLLILTIHAEYALQEYNTLTAGVGISIR